MRKIKLAVADTHQYFATRIKTALGQRISDFDFIFEATNKNDLFEKLQHDRVDVALLDASSYWYGANIVAMLKKNFPDVKLLMLNSNEDEDVMVEYITSGVNGMLIKKDNGERLANAIRQVHEKGNFVCDELSYRMFQLIAARGLGVAAGAHTLTVREVEIVKLIATENTGKEIAKILSISEKTVEGHRERILLKTGARNSIGIVLYAYKRGILK